METEPYYVSHMATDRFASETVLPGPQTIFHPHAKIVAVRSGKLVGVWAFGGGMYFRTYAQTDRILI